MAKQKTRDDISEEEVLNTIMAAIGMVLASKPGGKFDMARDRECAVNVLAALEEEGLKVARDSSGS